MTEKNQESTSSETSEPSFFDDPRKTALLFAVVAVAIRLWASLVDHKPGEYIFSDMWVYVHRSKQFLGRPLEPWDTFTPLGYPLFLAGIQKLSKDPWPFLGVVQAFLSGFTVVFAHRIALLTLKNARLAALVAALMAIHPALVFYSASVLTECLSAFLMTSLTLLVIEIRDLGLKRLILLGAVLGVSIMVRPNLLLLLPALAVWLWLADPLLAKKKLALIVCVCAPFLIWTSVHNTEARGKFTGLATNGGLNFFLAHAPYAMTTCEVPGSGTHHIAPIPNILRHKETFKSPVPFYDEGYFYSAGLTVLRRDPYKLVLALDNVLEGLSGGRQDYWPGWPKRERILAMTARLFFWFAALPAVLFAAALVWTRRTRVPEDLPFVGLMLLASTSLVTAYFFLGDPRVRVPYDALFIILGVEAWRRVFNALEKFRLPAGPADPVTPPQE